MRARGRRDAVPRLCGASGRSSPRDPTTRCSRSRCAPCWRTRSSRSAASIPHGPPPSEPWPSSPGSPDCGRRSGALPHLPSAASGGRWRAPTWGSVADAQTGLEALLADEKDEALQALYGTHGFLCEVLRLRGDLPGALAHGRRAVALAEERGSPFSRVEAAAFLGAAELAAGDVAAATRALEPRSRWGARGTPRCGTSRASWRRSRTRRLAAGDRSGARALLAEARATVERGRGWRLSACDVELAEIRLLASEPAPNRTALETGARIRGRPRRRAGRRSLSADGRARARTPRSRSVVNDSGRWREAEAMRERLLGGHDDGGVARTFPERAAKAVDCLVD